MTHLPPIFAMTRVTWLTFKLFAVSWALREALFTLKPEEAQPNVTLRVMNKFKSTGGGISFSGAILVFARPSFDLVETTPTNTPGYGKSLIY
jgi:hypothetical protein